MDPARDLEVTWRSSSAGAVGIPTGLRNPEKYCTAPPYWRYNGSELRRLGGRTRRIRRRVIADDLLHCLGKCEPGFAGLGLSPNAGVSGGSGDPRFLRNDQLCRIGHGDVKSDVRQAVAVKTHLADDSGARPLQEFMSNIDLRRSEANGSI
jgi:hypothetical protein